MYQQLRIFDEVDVIVSDRSFGDCNLTTNQALASYRVDTLVRKLKAKKVFAPKPNFSGVLVSADEDHQRLRGSDLIFRSGSFEDAVYTSQVNTALMFAPADCHIGIIVHPQSGWWSILHLGLESLIQKPNLFETTLKNAPSLPSDLLFWFGYGAGPCCYGLNRKETLDRVFDVCPEAIEAHAPRFGPRGGGVGQVQGFRAVDNVKIINQLARRYGFRQIEFSGPCTACARSSAGDSLYFSNLWNYPATYRNCIIAVRK